MMQPAPSICPTLQSNMWLVKKAASSVTSTFQNVLREQSQSQKLILDIISNRHEVMPIRKMGELASLSYSIQHFEQTLQVIEDRLREIKFERKSLKKRLNVLVLVTYLIKHGASGFIDEFRAMVEGTFSRYENMVNFVAEDDETLKFIMQEIRERARYIRTLLFDNAALLREKEIARMIKEKLFIQGGDYTSLRKENTEEEHKKSTSEKIEQFLEHYVWRYTAKIDQKLDKITDILISKIDQYLDGEMPETFQIEEDTQSSSMRPTTTKSEFQFSGEVVKKQEVQFIESKLAVKAEEQAKAEQVVQEIDLMDLQAKKPAQDLLIFNEAKPQGQARIMDDDQIQAFRSQLIGKPA